MAKQGKCVKHKTYFQWDIEVPLNKLCCPICAPLTETPLEKTTYLLGTGRSKYLRRYLRNPPLKENLLYARVYYDGVGEGLEEIKDQNSRLGSGLEQSRPTISPKVSKSHESKDKSKEKYKECCICGGTFKQRNPKHTLCSIDCLRKSGVMRNKLSITPQKVSKSHESEEELNPNKV